MESDAGMQQRIRATRIPLQWTALEGIGPTPRHGGGPTVAPCAKKAGAAPDVVTLTEGPSSLSSCSPNRLNRAFNPRQAHRIRVGGSICCAMPVAAARTPRMPARRSSGSMDSSRA